MYIFLKPGR